ncbi:MAG: methyltransferase domain-containing protein [Eubacteriales bacterium]|nr:methyltransferase domain-containing protein [Eubacteriales bacterium]
MSFQSTLVCPVCGASLARTEKVCSCPAGHSFDISRKGYVNLLLSSSRGHHGDDALMVKARTGFLSRGYYDRFSAELCQAAGDYCGFSGNSSISVIDAGCGEGKYTMDLFRYLLSLGYSAHMLGIDISKDAVSSLAGKSRALKGVSPDSEIISVVASTADMPIPDCCSDILLNVFSPFFADEFRRVLKPGGIIVRAVPLENHLIELKRLVYDKVYLNDVPGYEEEGFTIEEKREVKYRISLTDREDIHNLFMMTPYFYKTGENDQKKLDNAHHLEISLEFRIIIYRKSCIG